MGTSVDRSSTQSISEALSLHYASHGIAVESVTVVADPGRSSTAKETWSDGSCLPMQPPPPLYP